MKRYRTFAMILVGLAIGVLAWTGLASGESVVFNNTLPRQFKMARLGMALEELGRVSPQQIKRGQSEKPSQHTYTVASKDPYIHHIDYRFYRGRLYELAIYYRRDRLPHGYPGLVDRLRELYGRPVSEDFLLDPSPNTDILSTQKTVWTDSETTISLVDIRKLREGKEQYQLVLTMTDLALEQARQQAAQELVRQEERHIPVPVPERSPNAKLSAGSSTRLSQSSARS